MSDASANSGEESTVHALLQGQPLCEFSTEIPANWPDGHLWVYVSEPEKLTCRECQTRAVALAKEGGV